MKKALFFMIILLAILFGGIYLIKLFILHKEKEIIQSRLGQPITISATTAKKTAWTPELKSTGSLRTFKGVDITTELSGMIEKIEFHSGEDVVKGQVLAVLDIKPEIAKLHELKANAQLAKITYFRDKKQFSFGAISRQELDDARAQYQSTADLVAEQKALISQKIIHAPFSGRLGISAVYPGQFVSPGSKVVTIQTLDPIYVDFYLPQQDLGKIHQGQTIQMTLDRAPKKVFQGKITTINPIVDVMVRNAEVEATLSNPDHILLPGMFSNVSLYVGKPKQYITLPYSAIAFNPYGSVVFILKKTNKKYKGKTVWQANQSFISTGKTRGDQVAIIKGIKTNDMVVTAGQLKLRNKSLVVINNTITPPDKAVEKVPERS